MAMVSKRKVNRARRAIPVTQPAPLGGLNGRDALAEMPITDAFVLDNFFPNNTSVDTRGGCLDFATGAGAAVESIEVYTGAAGSKLLAFAGGDVFDVTTGGAFPAALASGKVSSQVTSCMFSNAGSQFLIIYSGADAPMSYDGTTLSVLAITGVTGSQNSLLGAIAFKGRMYLYQNDMLGFYYLAVGAIQGAASYFDLEQQSLKGGKIVAICSVSQNITGINPQDYMLFVTSEGEYIMYAGTDPSNAATWSLVGRYLGPAPIGKKGWFNFRSDVFFITEEGIISFSEIRQSGEGADTTQYLSTKLGRAYNDLTTYSDTFGWSAILYPRGNAIYVNVPMSGSETGDYCQFVMNTNTNAWARYIGWDSLCWAWFNRLPYYGTLDGRVVLADTGFTDNGMQIVGSARQAWSTFDGDGSQGVGEADKQFHFAAFAIQAEGSPAIACALDVNFEDDPPASASPTSDVEGASWDTATWDVDSWAGSSTTQNVTVPVGKVGYIASLWFQAVSTASTVRWFATRVILEKLAEVLLQ